MRLFGRSYTRSELERQVGDMSQLWGIRSVACCDGLETGTRLIQLWNANGLQLDVIPDRSMDLGRLVYKGIPLTWSSGTGYVHPAYLQESGWPGGFHGGLLATCGLNNVGPACLDEGREHEQHGRISRLPASHVEFKTVWESDETAVLSVYGEVMDRTSQGYRMQLSRSVRVEGDQSIIRLHDRVTNLGIAEEACMIKYHMNFGFPLVDETTQLVVPDAVGEKVTRISNFASEIEVHYIDRNEAGPPMREAIVRNPALNLELVIRFSAESLPHLWRWHDRRDTMQVFAVEPSNCRVKPRSMAKEAGCLPTLHPGESTEFYIEIEVKQHNSNERNVTR